MNASTRLESRVVAGARRPGVFGRHRWAGKVGVPSRPEDAHAGQALLGLLAETLAGLSADEAETRLSSAVGGAG
jgi:uncharacterized protein YggU (UPF0235/DUF167 family)